MAIVDIEDCHAFIEDCETERRDWIDQGRASWREIKKLKKDGKMFALDTASNNKRVVRFPIWNSTLNIRRPLVFGRIPTIVGMDTATGDDPTGRTAAILMEKLGQAIMKTFPFENVMCGVRDDALVTNLGTGRAYYECDWRMEKVKEPLFPQQLQDGTQIIVDENGKQISDLDDVIQDEDGLYRLTDKEAEVEYERVYFKHVLYSDIYIDPDATSWEDVKRVAFAWDYSERDFKKTFGKAALLKIPETGTKIVAETKRKVIRVYEYWDLVDRETKWFAQGSTDFLPKPNTDTGEGTEPGEEDKTIDDAYELDGFFPCPEPMLFNAPTDSFYPITEFYQLKDLIEEMHDIAGKMYQLTKAIRPRLMYDSSIPGLQKLISESATGDAVGVANLAAALAGAQGSILNTVAYLPIKDMVDALINYSQAFEAKKQEYFELSGTSDLLRGQTDNVERTYGEQQMKAKYAMNQIEPIQRDMQRFCRDSVELLCEMALKNFKDETLTEYIQPKTLDPEDQQRFGAALALLKDDKKRRFRIDVETDSTIALNEEFNKAAVTEATNALTKAVDYTAQTIERVPYLGPPMIKMVQELVKTFRIGKQVADEIDSAFQQAMEKATQAADAPPAPPPPPDPRLMQIEWDKQQWQLEQPERVAKLQTEQGRLNMEHQYRMGVLGAKQGDQQIKMYQINTDTQTAANQLQVDVLGIKTDGQVQTERTQIQAQLEQEKIDAGLQVEAMKAGLEQQAQQDQKVFDSHKALLAEQELKLNATFETLSQSMEQRRIELDHQTHLLNAQEKLLEEKRLSMENLHHKIDSHIKLLDVGTKIDAIQQKQEQMANAPKKPRGSRKIKISDDELEIGG